MHHCSVKSREDLGKFVNKNPLSLRSYRILHGVGIIMTAAISNQWIFRSLCCICTMLPDLHLFVCASRTVGSTGTSSSPL